MTTGDTTVPRSPRLLYVGADIDPTRCGSRRIVAFTRTRITCRTRSSEQRIIASLQASNKRLLDRRPDDPMAERFDYGSAFLVYVDAVISLVEMTLVWYSEEFYPVGRKMADNQTHRDIFSAAGIDPGDVTSLSYQLD